MFTAVRHPKIRLIAALLLAALAGSVVEGFLPHTDDGCAVEIHCLACRSHVGSAAVVTVGSVLAFASLPPALVFAADERPHGHSPIPRAPSRAPPLA